MFGFILIAIGIILFAIFLSVLPPALYALSKISSGQPYDTAFASAVLAAAPASGVLTFLFFRFGIKLLRTFPAVHDSSTILDEDLRNKQ
jgi:hypothetical protein